MNNPPFAIQVHCYAGYRGEETPKRFSIDNRHIKIVEIIERWMAPNHRYFKVRGNDGNAYIIRHDSQTNRWELTMYAKGSY